MQESKDIVLPNYSLVLSLLKYKDVWVFWNQKKSDPNRYSPLNNSIQNGDGIGHWPFGIGSTQNGRKKKFTFTQKT